MPAKIKNIIPLILLLLISQSLLGDIKLRTPYSNYNHYNPKGVHVSSILKDSSNQHSIVFINNHDETFYKRYKRYKRYDLNSIQLQQVHYPQISTPTSSFIPFEEKQSVNVGARDNVLVLGRPLYRPINDAMIQTYFSYKPFEETQTVDITNKKNAFAPPTEGAPINGILPLLVFSFIYLIIHTICLKYRNKHE